MKKFFVLICVLPSLAFAVNLENIVKQNRVQTLKNYMQDSKKLAEIKKKINVPDQYKKTPIFYATRNDNLEMTKLLIELGADAKLKDNRNFTPICYGVEMDLKLSITKGVKIVAEIKDVSRWLLLNDHADVNSICDNNLTALHGALWLQDKELVDYLIPRVDQNIFQVQDHRAGLIPIHLSVWQDMDDALAAIVKRAPESINIQDTYWEWTALHHSFSRGKKHIAVLLLENGADLNIKNKKGKIPPEIKPYKNVPESRVKVITKFAKELLKDPNAFKK